MDAYLLALDQNEDARQNFMRLMTVSISRFFRDRNLWKAIEAEIIPSLIKENPNQIKVWSAGCARGEEAYTFKILWRAVEERIGRVPPLEVRATDINPVYLDKAQAGIYTRSSLKELPDTLRDRFFQVWRKDKSWRIIASVKQGIRWQVRDLLSPPPDKDFHLVFLRNNLLTYYGEKLKVPAFERVVDSIAEGGYLIIGAHEEIPSEVAVLEPYPMHPCVFRKKILGSLTESTEARSFDTNLKEESLSGLCELKRVKRAGERMRCHDTK